MTRRQPSTLGYPLTISPEQLRLASAIRRSSGVGPATMAFWASKGDSTKRQPSNQPVGGEFVVPA